MLVGGAEEEVVVDDFWGGGEEAVGAVCCDDIGTILVDVFEDAMEGRLMYALMDVREAGGEDFSIDTSVEVLWVEIGEVLGDDGGATVGGDEEEALADVVDDDPADKIKEFFEDEATAVLVNDREDNVEEDVAGVFVNSVNDNSDELRDVEREGPLESDVEDWPPSPFLGSPV